MPQLIFVRCGVRLRQRVVQGVYTSRNLTCLNLTFHGGSDKAGSSRNVYYAMGHDRLIKL